MKSLSQEELAFLNRHGLCYPWMPQDIVPVLRCLEGATDEIYRAHARKEIATGAANDILNALGAEGRVS